MQTAKTFLVCCNEDVKVREYLKRNLRMLQSVGCLLSAQLRMRELRFTRLARVLLLVKRVRISSNCAPILQRIMGVPVHVSIEEIRKPEIDAQLIADSISQQLEKRIMFRRAMKRAMQNAMRLGAQGIKVMSAGRLNGAEIARSEWYREGRVPLHTLRADIDYATSEALTTYGIIGIKVWVYTRAICLIEMINQKRLIRRLMIVVRAVLPVSPRVIAHVLVRLKSPMAPLLILKTQLSV
jgi:small subunit ribosomal protein S3